MPRRRPLRPALFLAFALTLTAVATAQVTPLLHDVTWRLDTNAATAYYGYNNTSSTAVDVPFGQFNFFAPSPPFRGQPTTFQPGLVASAFTVTFPAGSFVEWTLGTVKLRASLANASNAITGSTLTLGSTATYPKLTVSGYTTLTLAGGTHTATNGVFLGAGSTLRLEAGVLNTATIALAETDGATLQFASAGTAESPFHFTRDGTATGAAPTVTGIIQLRQTSGYTVLHGALAHTAGTLIESGTLELGSGAALPTTDTVTLTGGTLRLASDDQTIAALAGTGGEVQLANNRTLTLTDTAARTFSGLVTGNGALAKTGSGTLTLDNANTYSGGTTLAAGTILVGHNTALGSGAVTLSGGHLGTTGGARTLANNFVLQSDTTFSGSDALTLTGNLTLARSRELTIAASAHVTVSGIISGAGRSLNKFGTGTLVLTGANTYTGGTYLDAGTTRINNSTGSAFGTGAVTVGADATLTGAGVFSGALQNNGTYAPGNSPTLASLSSFSQGPTGILEMEIAGLARGTGYDALDVAGSLTFGGTLDVVTYGAFTPASFAAGQSFDLFNWGSATGTFSTINLPDLAAFGLTWDTSALYTTGVLSVTASAVPEPSTYAALLGACALALVALRRRRATP